MSNIWFVQTVTNAVCKQLNTESRDFSFKKCYFQSPLDCEVSVSFTQVKRERLKAFLVITMITNPKIRLRTENGQS